MRRGRKRKETYRGKETERERAREREKRAYEVKFEMLLGIQLINLQKLTL